MKLLVIGSGGREHAIIHALKKNKNVEEIYCLPGNGGIAKDAIIYPIKANEIDAQVAFAKEKEIDYVCEKMPAIIEKLVRISPFQDELEALRKLKQ